MLTSRRCLPGLGLLALVACDPKRPTQIERTAPAPKPATTQLTAAAPPLDTTDVSRTNWQAFQAGHDTTFYLGRQRYRLLLRAETDSTKPLLAVSRGSVGAAFAADSATFAQTRQVRGYEGFHLITLLDSAGRAVFRYRLRKADFFPVASPDIVTVSEPVAPVLAATHAASRRLALSVDIGIPYSDVWQRVVLLLNLNGQRPQLFTGFASNWAAPDCIPRLLADGTLLTCQELVRPTGERRSLRKPKAELVAAFPLSDSILFTLYRFGQYRQVKTTPEEADLASRAPVEAAATAEFTEQQEWGPARRPGPNGFIGNTRGQVLHQVRYDGAEEDMGYTVPRRYVAAAHTYYLLDDERGVIALDKYAPTLSRNIPFQQMQPFTPPRRSTEIRFIIPSTVSEYIFYLDPQHPYQLRYQRRPRPVE